MSNRGSSVAQALRGPTLLITLGVLFELHQTHALSFSQTWPLLIIVVGLMKLLEKAVAPPKVQQARYGAPQAAGSLPNWTPGAAQYAVPPYYGNPQAARASAARSGGSIGGPLILIVLGAIFLAHTISPEIPIGSYLARYWPWLLVIWGGMQVLEILARASSGASIPDNGISGGGWFFVVLICFFGLASFQFHGAGSWWRRVAFERGVQVLGTEHDYQVASAREQAGPTPLIILESFRGSARIVGSDVSEVVVGGHKTVRSLDIGQADRTDRNTPLTIVTDGKKMLIRCNQDRADAETMVTTDLELTVPRGASLQVTGRAGDLDVSSIAGNIDISNGSGGVKVSNVDGNVNVDTRHADLIRCSVVKGAVQLRGHGTDVELENISGQVTISGDYGGTISLRAVLKPIRVESMETEVNAQQLPGELKIEPGSVTGQNLVGPLSVNTRATDVDLNGFTEGLNLNVEKGDIELKPSNVPISKMVVRTRAGNIDLALPESANFQLLANTRRGEIENEFGGDLTETTEGHGARLKGAIGVGPDLSLETTRGTITLRKASSDEHPAVKPPPPVPAAPRPKPAQMPVGKSIEL